MSSSQALPGTTAGDAWGTLSRIPDDGSLPAISWDRRVRVVVPLSVEEFRERAQPLLLADEARHNLALGILTMVTAHPQIYPVHRLWLVEREGSLVGAALRTPPHNLILPRLRDEAALSVLSASIGDELLGVRRTRSTGAIGYTYVCDSAEIVFEPAS